MTYKNLIIIISFFLISFLQAFQGNLTPSRQHELTITEPSGIVFNNNNGTLYTHSDNFSSSNIYQISTNGLTLDTLYFGGSDFEGITFNATFDTLYIVEEYASRIVKFTLDGKYAGEISVDVEMATLNGLEGITIDPATGHIFVVKEKLDPLLIELSKSGKELKRTTLNFVGDGDVSGIAFHPLWNNLFILSHQNQTIYETTLQGKYIRSWSIPVEKAEGITFNSTLDTIYIVDDLWNTMYVFPFNDQPFINNLYINEFMAVNNNTLSDGNGEFDDWIELYNPNDYSVDIGGLSIADNFLREGLWQIPKGFSAQTTIPPHGYTILWADEQTTQGPLHVNIKLNKSGEQIALYNGVLLLDSVSFSAQTDDISYGRQTDGADLWGFFNPASPNDDNTKGTIILNVDTTYSPVIHSFELKQNYPNPFNPGTVINYQLSMNNKVTLRVYDVSGREIATLVDHQQNAGTYSVIFEAGNLPSGIYFYTLQTNNYISTKRMMLIK